MHELTGFQRDLLYALAGLEEPHGLALKEELETYYGTDLNAGRLYPNLDTLVENGLVDKSERDRRSYSYAITNLGLQKIKDRREWEEQYLGDHTTE